jgi:hypothetical protein
MKLPWHNKTGYSKAIAAFATTLTISLGLCGANLALFSRYGYISGPNDPTRSAGLSMFLMATGFLEMIGIAVGLGGLVIGTLSLVGVSLYKRFSSAHKED